MKGSSWKEMLMPSVGMIFAIIAIVTSMIISKIAMSKGLSSFIIVVYSNAVATLILFPPSIFIFITRSGRRPLTFSVFWRIWLLALNGCFGQICDYVGISYSSPTLATAMLNLIPGFTFILAITFRMEVINWKSWSSYAKAFGTFVSIGGAFVLTFYKGPPIINQHLTSTFSSQQNWILGGVILACESMSTSLWYIIQASILKIYQEEMIIVCFYCFFVTIISALISLLVERNTNAWMIYPDIRLIAILYSGIIGIAFRSCMTTWCLKKTDPLFVSMFKPFAIVFALLIGTFCFRDVFYLGRSAIPPLWPTFLYGFFLLGIMGFLMQVLGFLGLQYSSPLLSTAILQLVPGFTFILAVILRMETFEYKSLSTMAKTIGTLVSIIGAFVATLFKGPQVFGISPLNTILTTPSAWAIGGLLTMICSLIASFFIISQAFVLKKYPAELILMLFYSCCVTILCAVFSLIIERDLNSWSLSPHSRLMAIICSGLFGNVFQVSIGAWCMRKKGPLFVVMFHPLGIVVAMAASICMGEIIHVGSLVGSIIIVIGFYSVIWGQSKEWKKKEKNLGSNNKKMPFLQDKIDDDPEVNI
ncbi:hypothetical protein KY285_023106 [Solanum tuberosum]|nr:hypothetical protein KY285_023106 [Solanum tuberosum]